MSSLIGKWLNIFFIAILKKGDTYGWVTIQEFISLCFILILIFFKQFKKPRKDIRRYPKEFWNNISSENVVKESHRYFKNEKKNEMQTTVIYLCGKKINKLLGNNF